MRFRHLGADRETGSVKTHTSRVLAELGLVSRTQAAVVAYESGIVGRERVSQRS